MGRLSGVAGSNQFEPDRRRRIHFPDAFFFLFDQRIEGGNLDRVVSLFVFAKAEQVGLVVGAETAEVQFVFPDDRRPQLLGPVKPGSPIERDTGLPFGGARDDHGPVVDTQPIIAFGQSGDA